MLLTRPQYDETAAALRSLALAGNALTDQHVGMLLEGLQGLLRIERVDLADNRLTRVAVAALGKTIAEGRAKHVRRLRAYAARVLCAVTCYFSQARRCPRCSAAPVGPMCRVLCAMSCAGVLYAPEEHPTVLRAAAGKWGACESRTLLHTTGVGRSVR